MSDRMTILNKIYGLKEDIQELQVLECKRLTEINNLRAENAALRAKLETAIDALKIADRYWFGDAEKGVVCATCDFGSIGEDHDKECPIGAAHKALSKIIPLPQPPEVKL